LLAPSASNIIIDGNVAPIVHQPAGATPQSGPAITTSSRSIMPDLSSNFIIGSQILAFDGAIIMSHAPISLAYSVSQPVVASEKTLLMAASPTAVGMVDVERGTRWKRRDRILGPGYCLKRRRRHMGSLKCMSGGWRLAGLEQESTQHVETMRA